MAYQRVKGTHDLIKKDAKTVDCIRQIFSNIATTYCYQSHYVPVIEYSELFTRSVGKDSDIVRKEMYTFNDKANRSITLRPEFTAGIIRSLIENKLVVTEPTPIKSYYFGTAYRYERPQTGRYREFYQGGVECVGTSGVYSDVEMLNLVIDFLSSLALHDEIHLKLNYLGSEETRNKYRDALRTYFGKRIAFMCPDCHERLELNPLRILDCKIEEDQKIIAEAPKITEFLTDSEKMEFAAIEEAVKKSGISYEVDSGLVRGLDYYSGLVFEVHPLKATVTQGAIVGGGHYHNLVAELGGPDLEGCGFSFGVERLMILLNELSISVEAPSPAKIYVMPLGEVAYSSATLLASELRKSGNIVEVNYAGGKLASAFKKAERLGMQWGVIIGDDEIKNATVQLKNLSTQEQVTISQVDLIAQFGGFN